MFDSQNKAPAGAPPSSQQAADPARLKESLNRLFEVYKEISQKADEVITTRCPYKDARSRCTANFGCRNQYYTKDRTSRPVCVGSDKLDYRSAWDI